MIWRDSVLHFLRVPHAPEPPPGSTPRVFRAAPNFFTLRALRWALTRFLALMGLIFGFWFVEILNRVHIPAPALWALRIIEVLGWLFFAFEAFVGWTIVRLDYELRWYMVSDRAIRVREGITTVREKTITLANIQNIGVKQGPLQRILGIADVEVKTAGGGGGSGGGGKHGHHQRPGESLHVAYFRGVANANEIRDLLLDGVRRQKDAGLGDHDDHQPVDEIQLAMSELLAAARGLRAGVERT